MKVSVFVKIALISLFVGFSGIVVRAEVMVSNVRLEQRTGTGLVDILYDLSSSEPLVYVSVEASDDGGNTFGVPVTNLEGDFGYRGTFGADRYIVWDALE